MKFENKVTGAFQVEEAMDTRWLGHTDDLVAIVVHGVLSSHVELKVDHGSIQVVPL